MPAHTVRTTGAASFTYVAGNLALMGTQVPHCQGWPERARLWR